MHNQNIMQNEKGYHRLLIWQKARKFVISIYKLTDALPKSEIYCLTSQMRRAALSVVLNIVEGDRRKSRKEFTRFLDIADGSLTEVEACLEICFDLNYITRDEFDMIESQRKELSVMIWSFTRKIQERQS